MTSALTSKDVDDGAQVGPLLDQATDSLASFTGDGAYDQDAVYDAVGERHPDAAVIVPPRRTVVRATMRRLRQRSATATFSASPRRAKELGRKPPLQQTRQGRGGNRAMETGDRRWTALTYGRASDDRSQRGGRCSQPHAGSGAPELCPHHLIPNGIGAVAYKPLIYAPRWSATNLRSAVWINTYSLTGPNLL
jgi:hypothetical protein